ncbi:hypothetical protein Tco_0302052, partial [Tanacetum coccineum]
FERIKEAIEMATELMDRRISTVAERQAKRTRGSLKTLLEITKTNNQTKGRTQAGLMLPGTVTRNRMRGLNLNVPSVTSTIMVLVHHHALTARSLATWPRTVGAGLQLQITTTTTKEPKGQIPMPSFALSVGLQATTGATAPSERTRIKEMVTM